MPKRVLISNPKRDCTGSMECSFCCAMQGRATQSASQANQRSDDDTDQGHQKAVRRATPGSMAASSGNASRAIAAVGMPR